MARLPNPGSDSGTWGEILNDYLSQSLGADGSLKPNTVKVANIDTVGGINGQVLTRNSTHPSGLQWTNPSTAGVTSVNTRTGAVTLDKADVGLSNVDNTSDSAKPVSTATQAAMNAKIDKSALDIDPTMSSNSDTKVASQKATKEYVDTVASTMASASSVGAKVLLIDNAAALPPGTPAGVVVVVKA